MLQHESHSRHRIGINPRFFDLDAVWTTFVLHIPEMERGFHDSAPLLIFVVGDSPLNIFETDEGLRVAEHTPAIALFPVVLALVMITHGH
jgi:hypothetical protein